MKQPRQVPQDVPREFPALTGFADDGSSRYEITGQVTVSGDGEVVLRGTGPSDWLSGRHQQFKAELTTTDGWALECQKCCITRVDNWSSFEAHPGKVTATRGDDPDPTTSASFGFFLGGDVPFSGDTFDHLGKRSVIDITHIRTASFLYGEKPGGFDKEVGYCYLASQGATVESDWQVLERTSMFLSLAYSRFIRCPYLLRVDSGGATRIEIVPTGGSGTAGNTLYVSYPLQVSDLLKNGWDKWDTTGKDLSLTHLINQYVMVRDQKFVDAGIMLACIWMEAFKHQYGYSVKKYKQDDSHYFLKPGSGTRYSFRELLIEGMQHFGIPNPYDGFIKTRNEVIHSGTITASIKELIEMKMRLEEAIESFFFTLFDFEGLIWDHATNEWVPRKP